MVQLVDGQQVKFPSSHNGRDRYEMAVADYECDKILNGFAYPTREQWGLHKQSLIAKSLLNKAGAITPKGRNAV